MNVSVLNPRATLRRAIAAGVLLVAAAGMASATTVFKGDVDGDGRITVADASLVMKSIVGLVTLTATQKLIADVNGDGSVNTLDVTAILQRTVGIIQDLGSLDLDAQTPASTSKVATAVVNNETVFTWPATGKSKAVLVFNQGANHVKVFDSITQANGKDVFTFTKMLNRQVAPGVVGSEFALLKGYNSNPISVDVFVTDAQQGPFTKVDSVTVKPVQHAFDLEFFGPKELPEVILKTPLPDVAKAGDTISVTGKVMTDLGLRGDVYLIPPSGVPQKIRVTTTLPLDPGTGFGPKVLTGQEFKFQFKTDDPGVYVVEVNNYAGSASLNRPIYVGLDGVPLIPGNLDFQTQPDPAAAAPDASRIASEWLTLVNADRTRFKLNPVSLDEHLTTAARAHTADMAKQKYFGHIGLDGSDPSARATRAGVPISALVGENLAQAATVPELEAGLMASALHRADLLNPDWKRVGLGVAKFPDDGLLFGAQEFDVDAGEYQLPIDFFGTLTLDKPLDTALPTGKDILVSGKVNGDVKTIVVFLLDPTNKKQKVFPPFPVAPNADGTFSIAVNLDKSDAGTYQFGISLDGKGSTAAYVTVK